MSILVTGGAGYVGSHVVRALARGGSDVVILDRIAPRRATRADASAVVVGDVRDQPLLERMLVEHEVESVVHLAAEKSVAASMEAPGPTFSTNVGGTLAVVDAMAAQGVRHLVFSSTCAVYGTPDEVPVSEAAPLRPQNPYGESKAQAEALVRWYDELCGVRSVVLRYFNAAGADPEGDVGEDWSAPENLVPVVLRAAWTGGTVEVFGTDYPTPDGTAVRDYVHVADLAEAHLLALDYLASGGESATLNLGTGIGASVAEVIAAARGIVGRPIAVVEGARRAGDAPAIWADSHRAGSVLGWQARRGLHEMLTDAWRWHVREAERKDEGFDHEGSTPAFSR